jgi:uncharacterized damage-inducible protein DinB
MATDSLIRHFQTLARYNSIVNQRLYDVCAGLSDSEYRKERFGSFGSIHRTLNHILLGDRIWMDRFEGCGTTTPPLATILYEEFAALREARENEDARIERFMADLKEEFFAREIRYVNSKGVEFSDPPELVVPHMFNHQTHHRAQIHTLLSHAGVQPPSLDMHRAIKPMPASSVRGA